MTYNASYGCKILELISNLSFCFPSLSKSISTQHIMKGFISIIGSIGDILSAMQYLAPLPTFWRIVKNKSTEEFECLPYICTILNSSLWTYYGLVKPQLFVASVNGFGILAESIYVAIFLYYAPPTIKVDTAILATILSVVLPGAAITVTWMTLQGHVLVKAVGVLCIAPMIVMFASPLSALRTVMETKSVEYMPFTLSLILFLAGAVWTLYAALVHDYFIGVPNAIGFVFGSIQLIVYAIYRKGPQRSSETDSLSARLIEGEIMRNPLDTPKLLRERDKDQKWWKPF